MFVKTKETTKYWVIPKHLEIKQHTSKIPTYQRNFKQSKMNENKNIRHQYLWHTAKAVQGGGTYIFKHLYQEKGKGSEINNLSFCLKKAENVKIK